MTIWSLSSRKRTPRLLLEAHLQPGEGAEKPSKLGLGWGGGVHGGEGGALKKFLPCNGNAFSPRKEKALQKYIINK